VNKWFEGWCGSYHYSLQAIENLLNEKYGSPPIVRTYNGESAETHGITSSTVILIWSVPSEFYEAYHFNSLRQGDRWMLQPAAPKEKYNYELRLSSTTTTNE
jgi:hypothetical protein